MKSLFASRSVRRSEILSPSGRDHGQSAPEQGTRVTLVLPRP